MNRLPLLSLPNLLNLFPLFLLLLLLLHTPSPTTANSPKNEHIFVFKGESYTIDCTGKEIDPILKYRKDPTADAATLFIGDLARADGARVSHCSMGQNRKKKLIRTSAGDRVGHQPTIVGRAESRLYSPPNSVPVCIGVRGGR